MVVNGTKDQCDLSVPCEARRAAGVWWGPLYWETVFYTADRPVSPSLSVSLPFHLSRLLLLHYQFQHCRQGPDPAAEVESSRKSNKTKIPDKYHTAENINFNTIQWILPLHFVGFGQVTSEAAQTAPPTVQTNKKGWHPLIRPHPEQVIINYVHQGRVCK